MALLGMLFSLSKRGEVEGKAKVTMNGHYPRFKNFYFYEELTENFLLTPTELEFVRNCRGQRRRAGGSPKEQSLVGEPSISLSLSS
jgi:hypothetical protein